MVKRFVLKSSEMKGNIDSFLEKEPFYNFQLNSWNPRYRKR